MTNVKMHRNAHKRHSLHLEVSDDDGVVVVSMWCLVN